MFEYFIFFTNLRKKWPKTYQKCVLSFISKYLRDIHIFYGHYWIPRTQKHGYRHQNRDSSYARAQVIAKYVISMAAILNVSKNEVEGREKLNPNIFGLFDP